MIVLLSPAKTLDLSKTHVKKFTQPQFLAETQQLVSEYKKYSVKELMQLMNVSEKIAQLNVQRWQDFSLPFTLSNAKQAILAFNGDVYRDMDVDNYSQEDFEFLQNNVRIVSGLYGLLRPLDLIQPYRLEMHLKTKFWKGKLKLGKVINLASKEYFSAVSYNEVITPVFKEGDRIVAIYAKIARGTMTNWIVKNKITPDRLKEFNEDGYKFIRQEGNELIFER
jgi:uncharacterized protein